MEEQFVSFETAKLAKEKGFNWKVRSYFQSNGYSFWTSTETNLNNVDLIVSRSTQSLLQKWLREVHEIDIYIKGYGFGYYPSINNVPPGNQDNVKYIDRRWNLNNELMFSDFKTFEQALEKGLQEALKLI